MHCTQIIHFPPKGPLILTPRDKGINASPLLTSVGVIEEHEAAPVVVVQQGEQGPPDGGPQLQGELGLALGGEAGRDEADVERAAERRQSVHRLPVVETEDGVDAPRKLGADWRGRRREVRDTLTTLCGPTRVLTPP